MIGCSANEAGAPRFSRRRLLVGIGAGMLLGTGAACASTATRAPTPTVVPLLAADPAANHWPAQFVQADPDVQDAYRFAIAHAETQFIPCYCGCVNQKHASNRDCYVAAESTEGLVLSSHAFDCGICVSITHDVMALEGQAVPLRAIRERIDAKWGLAGPGTRTDVPQT